MVLAPSPLIRKLVPGYGSDQVLDSFRAILWEHLKKIPYVILLVYPLYTLFALNYQMFSREEIDTEPISADLLFALVAPDGLRELTRACMLILKQKYDEARQRLVNTGKAEPLQQPVNAWLTFIFTIF